MSSTSLPDKSNNDRTSVESGCKQLGSDVEGTVDHLKKAPTFFYRVDCQNAFLTGDTKTRNGIELDNYVRQLVGRGYRPTVEVVVMDSTEPTV